MEEEEEEEEEEDEEEDSTEVSWSTKSSRTSELLVETGHFSDNGTINSPQPSDKLEERVRR